MHLVAGANIFGQWFCELDILNGFQTLLFTKEDEDFKLDSSTLMHIGWSYNVYKCNANFYISGFWSGNIGQFIKLSLPEINFDCESLNKFIITGNDYNLLIVNKESCNVWVLNLETLDVKRINLLIEKPKDSKKIRETDNIAKVVVENNSCLYLTERGAVYIGILPSYVDTTHCNGVVIDIKCGYEHYCLLTDAGGVYTWGNGRRLQLGHGDLNSLEVPTEIKALSGIKITKICARGWHTLALSEHGDLYVWGWNDSGQLGVKESADTLGNECGLPKLVDFTDEHGKCLNVQDIAAGSRHSVVKLEDNTIWAAGFNKYGQLGLSPEEHEKVESFTKVFTCDSADYKIKCGMWSTVLIKR